MLNFEYMYNVAFEYILFELLKLKKSLSLIKNNNLYYLVYVFFFGNKKKRDKSDRNSIIGQFIISGNPYFNRRRCYKHRMYSVR